MRRRPFPDLRVSLLGQDLHAAALGLDVLAQRRQRIRPALSLPGRTGLGRAPFAGDDRLARRSDHAQDVVEIFAKLFRLHVREHAIGDEKPGLRCGDLLDRFLGNDAKVRPLVRQQRFADQLAAPVEEKVRDIEAPIAARFQIFDEVNADAERPAAIVHANVLRRQSIRDQLIEEGFARNAELAIEHLAAEGAVRLAFPQFPLSLLGVELAQRPCRVSLLPGIQLRSAMF